MLLTITNQDIMNRLSLMNSDSWTKTLITVGVPALTTIIVLLISNLFSQRQIKNQFDEERKKSVDDKSRQLHLEEKMYVEKKAIENLTELIPLIFPMFEEQIFPNALLLDDFYASVRHGASKTVVEQETKDFDEKFHMESNLLSENRFKLDAMIAYASPENRMKYQQLITEISDFEAEKVNYRIYKLNFLDYPGAHDYIFKDQDYYEQVDNYRQKIGELVGDLQRELYNYVDNALR